MFYALFTFGIPLMILPIVEVKRMVAIDENWICNVKDNCFDCLSLSQCAWCNDTIDANVTGDTLPKCFSPTLTQEFCKTNTIVHTDHGLSLAGNAKCSCAGGEMEHYCRPAGAAEDDPECSGRGVCQCGRCVCDPTPDLDHPTKIIMGKFCEYDNFSCDSNDCNEGPYPLEGSYSDSDSPDTRSLSLDGETEQPQASEEINGLI